MISEIQIKSIDTFQSKRSETIISYPFALGLSDSAIYYYVKEATFLSKKQQRLKQFFFQGLNTNPQNLSVFLMDESSRQTSKQKLVKGTFNIYDCYNKVDCVIEINIPGNLKIYKIVNNKKQVISNEEIDMMYVSSVLRSFYERGLHWGRYYKPFNEGKISEFENFLKLFLKISQKHQVYISEQFEANAEIKGSHSSTLLLRFIKDKRISNQAIDIIRKEMEKNPEIKKSPKINILMSELHNQMGKYSKSIQYTALMAKEFSNDPYILYYKAKYLLSLLMIEQAIHLLNSIVQYNQFQIWILLSSTYIENKRYADALLCLNNASKISKCKSTKPTQSFWKAFEEIGKIKIVSGHDPIHFHPRLSMKSQNPLSLPVRMIQEKFKSILEHGSWKLNPKQFLIFKNLQKIYYKMDQKRFNQLFEETFLELETQFNQVMFKKGLTDSMFVDNLESTQKQQYIPSGATKQNIISQNKLNEQLPHFLQEQQSNFQQSGFHQTNRNLSIIPEIQSVIQNSNYEQKQKQNSNFKKGKNQYRKREISQNLLKILKVVLSNGEYQKAVFEDNYAKVLPIYNKLRSSSIYNHYYSEEMFKIFSETANYNSIVVLVAEILDFIEGKGMRKMRKLPYWLENWIFFIINQQGLKFLLSTFNKLNFVDEAVMDTVEMAKKWNINGTNS